VTALATTTSPQRAAGAGGYTAPGFEPMRSVLERAVARRGEDGCAVGAYVDGVKVVDLWCGRAGGRPWAEDTLAVMFSASKGVTALCAQILYSRGLLDLDARVTTYWPEYGQAGKAGTLVRHLLNHRAGVVSFPRYWEVLGREAGGLADWRLVVEHLAASPPSWPPGSRRRYHPLTYGFLVGEVIRRIDGRTPGRFFADEVAGPLGLDLHIGVAEKILPRVAETLAAPPVDLTGRRIPLRVVATMLERSGNRARTILRDGGSGIEMRVLGLSGIFDDPNAAPEHNQLTHIANDFLGAELPAGNAVASGRDLARMYALLACGGELDGVRLVSPESIERFRPRTHRWLPPLMGMGMGYSQVGLLRVPTRSAFGHPGAGGALGFADTERRVSFGLVKNRMRNEPWGVAADLVRALYACL
jgi:CubicO group peptidase (beta-lactamase class C family)